jgi:hypothetical protein
MTARILCAAFLSAVLAACAGKTPPPAQPPAPPPAPQACAEQCERELHECVGNTLERDRYSTCMPENDECVMACFDVV